MNFIFLRSCSISFGWLKIRSSGKIIRIEETVQQAFLRELNTFRHDFSAESQKFWQINQKQISKHFFGISVPSNIIFVQRTLCLIEISTEFSFKNKRIPPRQNKPVFVHNKKPEERRVQLSVGFPLFEKPICINVTLTTSLSAESLSSFA